MIWVEFTLSLLAAVVSFFALIASVRNMLRQKKDAPSSGWQTVERSPYLEVEHIRSYRVPDQIAVGKAVTLEEVLEGNLTIISEASHSEMHRQQKALSSWLRMLASSLYKLVKPKALAGQTSARIEKPPGVGVMRAIRWVFSKKSVTRVFEPIEADLQFEYFQALQSGEIWKAHWIRFRFYLTVLKTLPVMGLAKLAHSLYEEFKRA